MPAWSETAVICASATLVGGYLLFELGGAWLLKTLSGDDVAPAQQSLKKVQQSQKKVTATRAYPGVRRPVGASAEQQDRVPEDSVTEHQQLVPYGTLDRWWAELWFITGCWVFPDCLDLEILEAGLAACVKAMPLLGGRYTMIQVGVSPRVPHSLEQRTL